MNVRSKGLLQFVQENRVGSGPLAVYAEAVRSGTIQQDPAQREALQYLQQLYELLQRPPKKLRLWQKIFSRRPIINPIQGLYLWGGVGRGKTFLMDTFFECVPLRRKKRVHFHRFMRMVHRQLRSLQGEDDPLDKVAEKFADKVKLLCFDEFYIGDIADAMILAGLLKALFARGVVLVATSNTAPDNLYENGLQRARFIPAIEMIKRNTQVLNVSMGIDYRLRALTLTDIYRFPLNDAADQCLSGTFSAIAPAQRHFGVNLKIEGRLIRSRACAEGVVWFEFSDICGGPRSQNDYIELARIYQSVLISNIPQMDTSQDDLARRFLSLVDEFYDCNVNLIVSAAVPVRNLYIGTRLAFEFRRTESRLLEMQSQRYLSREHRA